MVARWLRQHSPSAGKQKRTRRQLLRQRSGVCDESERLERDVVKELNLQSAAQGTCATVTACVDARALPMHAFDMPMRHCSQLRSRHADRYNKRQEAARSSLSVISTTHGSTTCAASSLG